MTTARDSTMTLQQAIAYLHPHVNSSHNADWKQKREAWDVIMSHLSREAQHSDDSAVDAFAAAMKMKLAEAREKGRSGWNDKNDCSQQTLSDMLRKHVDKGDPRDVANFCMFLYMRGEAIAPARDAVVSTTDDLVNEGLDYFYKAGDAGDKEYVSAIRRHIERLESLASRKVVLDVSSIPRQKINRDGYFEECKNGTWMRVQDVERFASMGRDESRKVVVQDGYVLVPVEPTYEMMKAFLHSPESLDGEEELRGSWQAMLNAAPSD